MDHYRWHYIISGHFGRLPELRNTMQSYMTEHYYGDMRTILVQRLKVYRAGGCDTGSEA